MTKFLTALSSGLLLASFAWAQQEVPPGTQVAELEKMSLEFSQRYSDQRAKAEAYAKANNLLLDHYLPNGKVISMIGLDEFGKPIYQQTYNNSTAAATISTNRVYPVANGPSKYNLTGRGYRIGVWDGGTTRITHREFQGRAIQSDNGTLPLSEHATHVGGTVGAGGIQPNIRGMAYESTILACDWANDDSEMASRAAQGVLVSNHSYGAICGWDNSTGSWVWNGNASVNPTYDFKFGYYDSRARDWDRIMFNAPYYLIVKSAGNSRGEGPNDPNRPNNGPYDCLPTYSVAKNILTVGAVNGLNNGYNNPNGVVMSSFSSWGPADDGRIKPDVVGNGVGVRSLGIGSDVQTVELSGTSMSGPSVAGSCLLLQEHFSNTHRLRKMRNSTLKGLVIHTADECWNFPGPDYRFGWGLMNTRKAADVISNDSAKSLIIEDVLTNQQVKEIQVTASGTEQLAATLCWTDFQGTPGPAAYNSRLKMLVNDLDLRIINNNTQQVFFPWRLNPDSAANPARKGDNEVDNVEKVEVGATAAGTSYTIRISHKGTLFSNAQVQPIQNFSLIVSGVVAGDTARQCLPTQYFNASTARFDDGSATRPYNNNADCNWIINPRDSNSIVELIFRSFNVAAGDTLYCYSVGTTDTLIAKLSGTSLPDTVYSTTTQMRLNFRTNSVGTAPGWEVEYRAIEKPRFDFTASSNTACSGSTLNFSVVPIGTTNILDWTYIWNFPGSSTPVSNAALPQVGYPVQGVFPVSLTVTNRAGSITLTKNDLIRILPQVAPNVGPAFQGFENSLFPSDPNPDLAWTNTPDANPWRRNELAPFEGNASMSIRNNTNLKNVREITSPAFDISNIPAEGRVLSFHMAYARIITAATVDQLRVLVSGNCGQTWTPVIVRNNTTNPPLSTIGMGNGDIVTSTFIPEPSQYRKDSVMLSMLPANTTSLLVKFEMTSERGNILYIDNLNIGRNVVSNNALYSRNQDFVRLVPNPNQGEAFLEWAQDGGNQMVSIQLFDVTGKRLNTYLSQEHAERLNTKELFGTLQKGVYLIQISKGNKIQNIRWIVN